MTILHASIAGAIALSAGTMTCGAAGFGPANPFYAPSTLPLHAPPFDKIKDEDYQPAIGAGMARQLAEMQRIADNAAAPTFENTFVALEKSGRLLNRALAAFQCADAG
jgi:peptidyl-dipeptidase Dcp